MSWDKLDRSEVINIIDRDRDYKSIECKYSVATLYRHQQIIIICNDIPKIFVDDNAVKSRVTVINIENDLRDIELKSNIENRRSTTRGNHLRNPPPDSHVIIVYTIL